jgi:hypothetical protein
VCLGFYGFVHDFFKAKQIFWIGFSRWECCVVLEGIRKRLQKSDFHHLTYLHTLIKCRLSYHPQQSKCICYTWKNGVWIINLGKALHLRTLFGSSSSIIGIEL